jgi:drug/metabolite transporter (DMT)-like permease
MVMTAHPEHTAPAPHPQKTLNPKRGIILMMIAVLGFAAMDGMSKYMGERYHIISVVMIRMWFFALFVIIWSVIKSGGIRAAARSHHPIVQFVRGGLLALQICVAVSSFVILGLAQTHAIFACYPLLVVALSIIFLGERVGWQRISAIFMGCVGILIIIQPGTTVFKPEALIAVAATLGFAAYNVLTRYVAKRDDPVTSFFWTGIAGCIVISLIGPFFWTPILIQDWGMMIMLCITAMLAHLLMIMALDAAETTTLQPFALLQIVYSTLIGLILFKEVVEWHVFFGAIIIVASGLFAFWREARVKQSSVAPVAK